MSSEWIELELINGWKANPNFYPPAFRVDNRIDGASIEFRGFAEDGTGPQTKLPPDILEIVGVGCKTWPSFEGVTIVNVDEDGYMEVRIESIVDSKREGR